MFTLGNKKQHGTYNPSTIYRNGEGVMQVFGIPQSETLEELDAEDDPRFREALRVARAVVAALNEAEKAGKL